MQIHKLTSGLWKVCILKRKKIRLNILQSLITTLMFTLLPFLRIHDVFSASVIQYNPKTVFTFSTINNFNKHQLFLFTPMNNMTEKLMEKLFQTIPIIGSLYDGEFRICNQLFYLFYINLL